MIDLKHLLDMVATDALEPRGNCRPQEDDSIPIRYTLELIETSEGDLYWIE